DTVDFCMTGESYRESGRKLAARLFMMMLSVFAAFTAVFLGAADPQTATPGKPRSQALQPTAPAIASFLKRVEDYASLHRRVVAKVGSLDPTKSPQQLADREKALGEALRAARAGAKPGD